MKIYTVQEGDNIVSIAKKFNVRVTDIVNSNDLGNSYYLKPGDEIFVPVTVPSGFTYYTVKIGDTLNKIASMYNLTLNELSTINGLDINEPIYPNDKLLVPLKGIEIYITKENDRLTNLSNKLEVTKEDILFYNPNLYLLPGQLITYKKKSR